MFFSICIFMCTVCNIENILYYLGLKFFELVAALIDITWFYQGLEEFKTIVIRNSIVKVSGVVCIFFFCKNAIRYTNLYNNIGYDCTFTVIYHYGFIYLDIYKIK